MTGSSQPFGAKARAMSPRRAPGSVVSRPVSGSNDRMRSRRVVSIERPFEFSATSP
jgi:hypothetical protein